MTKPKGGASKTKRYIMGRPAKMKTHYRDIYFTKYAPDSGAYVCRSKESEILLGVVGKGAWTAVVFQPVGCRELSRSTCLDIGHFIGQLDADGKPKEAEPT